MERSHSKHADNDESFSGFDQIDAVLRDSADGTDVAVIAEKYNLPVSIIYQWRALFLPGFKHRQQLKALEEENAQLKQFITDAMSDGIAAKAHILNQLNSNLRERIRPRRSPDLGQHPPEKGHCGEESEKPA
ncbi:helix-turn-helix domain-containing protein [Microvirga lotononidis]|uniref:Transposase n=1 Tax=Microvirga lotononidis TaxID=864069 RepID=I4YVN4_9HYPH|nr:hypothetical protein [Microvirga lotononidis]EIM28026.1 hypothetical protein MicloDRAFT_00046030 [Microvirga lotononidis]WQO27863.1 hypothetical protein U0023_01760 [Microvirga lotononidis]